MTLLIITGLSSIVVADDWPMFHHDLINTGYSTSEAPEEHSLIWTYYSEAKMFCSPVISDGRVYVGAYDWNLYCLNENDGTKIWSYKTHDSVESTPAVADGKVYFGSNGGGVYCLDADDGTKIWQCNEGFEFSSSPKVYDEKVYIGSEIGRMYCLDADDGSKIWEVQTGVCVLGSPAIYNNKVYIGSWAHDEVFCLNANNGNTIWTFKGETCMHSSPVIVDGKVYIGGHILYCLNADNGNEIWSYQIKVSGKRGSMGEFSCPAVVDGKVYFGSTNHTDQISTIFCLDAEDGSNIWEYPIDSAMDSAPAVVGGKVYLSTFASGVFCIDAEHGSNIWNDERGLWSPAVANNRIYFGGCEVYCYGDDTGNQPPNIPTIEGPPSGNKEVEYWYTFNATDPNGNYIWYSIDWGDGVTEEWIGPRDSGWEITMSHTWYSEGTYTIRVKVKDVFDEESDYAILEVSMPKNKLISISYLLQSFFQRFPFFEKILNQIVSLENQ